MPERIEVLAATFTTARAAQNWGEHLDQPGKTEFVDVVSSGRDDRPWKVKIKRLNGAKE